MIEKRRSGLCTITIPPLKTRTSRTRSQSLRVSLVEDNPLTGVLRERTVADDVPWVIMMQLAIDEDRRCRSQMRA